MAGRWKLVFFIGLCIASVLAAAYSGSIAYKREFFSAQPYIPSVAASGVEVPRAKDYAALRDEIIALTRKGSESGTIHLESYEGDVAQDLRRVCDEVKTATPVGAYAVETIHGDYTRVLTYYDVKINIGYNRGIDEINAIVEINSQDELTDNIRKAISERKESLAVLCMYYTPEILDVHAALKSMKFDLPYTVYGLDKYAMSLFPSEGIHRIIKIDFSYYEGSDMSREKISLAQSAVDELAAAADGLSGRALVEKICEMISSGVTLIQSSAAENALPYSVLINKTGTAEGLAITLNQVLASTGTYSAVIEGELNGKPHFWNKAFVEGGWKYVDLSRGIILSSQEEMLGYKWEDMQ